MVAQIAQIAQVEWAALGVTVFIAVVSIAFHAGSIRGKLKQLCDVQIQHANELIKLNKVLTNHIDHLYKKVNEQAVNIASMSAKLDSVCIFIKGSGGNSNRKEKI